MHSDSGSENRSRKYYSIGGKRLGVIFGKLEESHCEALVSSDDNYLSMGGGVSASLRSGGGPQVTSDARKHIPLRLGDVAVTSAGDLPAKYVFHGITIDRDALTSADSACVAKITRTSLEIAEALGLTSIAFPALATGTARFPHERSAEALTLTLVEFLSREAASLESVDLVILPEGVGRPEPVERFHATAARLATQWTDIRRLRELVAVVRRISPVYNLARTDEALRELDDEIARAANLLDMSTADENGWDAVRDRLRPLTRQVADATSTPREDGAMPDETEAENVLSLRLQSLRTQVNILIGNLNQLEERKAQYGPLSTPLEVENSISLISREVEEKESEIREIIARLS